MLARIGESTDPWAVPISGRVNSSPSSTPSCKHLPMSRNSDPSAIRVWSISTSAVRSTLSKKGHDVRLQNPTHFALMNDPVQGSHGVMGTASGPEAMRAVQEVLLIDRLQHLTQGLLHELVLERRNPNRPRLALALRNVDATDRLMPITLRLQPLVQVLKPHLQILSVLLLRRPIHAHRRTFALAVVGASQGRHIDQMRQRVEPPLGLALRSFHYLQESR